MQTLSNVIISLFDLIESETELLKKHVVDVVIMILFLVGAAVAAFTGLGLLLMAVFKTIQVYWVTPWPLVTVAFLCFAITGAFIWVVYRVKN